VTFIVHNPLIVLTVLKKTKLNKIDEYYDQIENKIKSRTKLKKSNEN